MQEIKLIISDFDGVILDSEVNKQKAFRNCFSIFPTHLQEFLSYNKEHYHLNRYQKIEFFLKNILKYEDENLKRWLQNRLNQLLEKNVLDSQLIEGALQFLERYSNYSNIYLLSGTPIEQLYKIISKLEIDKYIKKVYSVPPDKNEQLKLILRSNQLQAKEVIYIGDMISDQIAATNNEINFIGIKNNYSKLSKKNTLLNNFISIDKILFIKNEKLYLTEGK